MGAGMWRPDKEPLQKIRERILEHPEEWLQASSQIGPGLQLELGAVASADRHEVFRLTILR